MDKHVSHSMKANLNRPTLLYDAGSPAAMAFSLFNKPFYLNIPTFTTDGSNSEALKR